MRRVAGTPSLPTSVIQGPQTVATVDANVRRKTMTGALSRLTKDLIVTTNLHSNNVQGMSERSGRASTRSAPVQLVQTCARSELSYI